jgi:hypothetical protein
VTAGEIAVPPEIRDAFAAAFASWPELRLPVAARRGEPQELRGGGWWVSYRLDLEGDDPSLTYFAHHRMSDDELCRIDSAGRRETLGTAQLFYVADDPGAEQEYYEHNRGFYEQVDRLGLGRGAPIAAAVNAYLRQGGES